MTSVIVLRITPPASAGSILSFERRIGRNAPEKAATTRLVIIAREL